MPKEPMMTATHREGIHRIKSKAWVSPDGVDMGALRDGESLITNRTGFA
jgi:hypothetical protein